VAALSYRRRVPVALTIAGSDSGGGAGIQADVKVFAALGVHGACAITCLTAQNPRQVLRIEPCAPRMLRAQIQAVWQEMPPAAVKTGMLFSGPLIKAVGEFFEERHRPPLVVDPVMIATSGRPLLERRAVSALEALLPKAALVTPNLHEAEMLSGRRLADVEDLRVAAKEIYARHGCAVLVKGGHLEGMTEAADIFFDGKTELLLSAPFVRGVRTHGTGCTYSAAITAFLARGCDLSVAVRKGKDHIVRAIDEGRVAAGHFVLG
jgi:hydroxymethylpyrimidine kinase/phosphomethylpyrimidine kinase